MCYFKYIVEMRFRKKETAQDVVVCCCILYNMRKEIIHQEKVYDDDEYHLQNEINQSILNELQNVQGQRRPFRLQNFLIENYF